MILRFSAIDQQGEIRNFSFQVEKLEAAFAFLTYVVEQGHSLQRASILDGTSLTRLPIEAFDGRPFSDVLDQLEASWQHVLNQPSDQSTPLSNDHCIVYFSTAVRPFNQADLMALLAKSRQRNAQVNITGVLLYVHGSIIQVLEGEQAVLTALFDRIKQDTRHTQVKEVFNRPVPQRLFSNWSMGFETLTALQLTQIETTIGLESNPAITSPPLLATISAICKNNPTEPL
ncbi:Photoactivated adenylate cyclase subunit beta [Fibrisoma limi BUZ 3]|uniref:Photoactivated adenylate cyclase subunit beta n=1 Tax=Fibrisoma limi BUZ 3 TaxID=1185876 RepID=I2GNV8_9BACT|nr:BLUF domain-containing protein [Fibrisoma limi]CCH55586.1 Photoactivated adenylate cyclase subunit beta [Fibrisoma limi BUZ 3]